MSAGRILVLADAHLRGRADPAQAEFVGFLERARPGLAGVVLLGDVFEYLAGPNRAALAAYAPVLEALGRLPEVHWVEGNHDFDLPRALPALARLRIHPGPVRLSLQGLGCLCMHGDRMSPFDLGTRALRAALQSGPIRLLRDRVLPDEALLRLALGFARHSRERTWPGRGDEAAWLRRRARRELGRGGLQVVLFAHTHQALLERWPEGLLANPGPARSGGSYLELGADRLCLRAFPGGTRLQELAYQQ